MNRWTLQERKRFCFAREEWISFSKVGEEREEGHTQRKRSIRMRKKRWKRWRKRQRYYVERQSQRGILKRASERLSVRVSLSSRGGCGGFVSGSGGCSFTDCGRDRNRNSSRGAILNETKRNGSISVEGEREMEATHLFTKLNTECESLFVTRLNHASRHSIDESWRRAEALRVGGLAGSEG